MAEEKSQPATDDSDATALIAQGLKPQGNGAAASAKVDPKPDASAPAATDAAADAAVAAADPVATPAAKPGDDIAALQKKIADLESREKARTLTLDGEYAKARFIAEGSNGVPIPLLEKWLPATTNKEDLSKALNELEQFLFKYMDVKRPRPNWQSATRDGGETPAQTLAKPSTDRSAGSLIADGLQQQRRN